MSDQYPSTEDVLNQLAQEGTETAKESQAQDETHGKPQEEAPPPPKEAAETPYLDFDQYKGHVVTYKADNKEVKEPLEKVLQRASQGYHYAQRMEALKAEQAQMDELKSRAEALSKWEQYDKYASDNPEWAKHVETMWAERDRYSQEDADPDDPHLKQMSEIRRLLDEKLGTYDQKLSQVDQLLTQKQSEEADKALDQEVGKVKEQFKAVDFDKADMNGETVEYKVLKHMTERGINSFRTAFLDLYHDELVQKASERVKVDSANERQKQAKQGIIGVSSTPKFAPKDGNSNVSGMSWEQLAEMAKDELRKSG